MIVSPGRTNKEKYRNTPFSTSTCTSKCFLLNNKAKKQHTTRWNAGEDAGIKLLMSEISERISETGTDVFKDLTAFNYDITIITHFGSLSSFGARARPRFLKREAIPSASKESACETCINWADCFCLRFSCCIRFS